MPLFLKVTLAVAAGLVLLTIVGFLLHILVIAALIGAAAVGVTTLVRLFRRRRGEMVVMGSAPRRF